MRGATRHLALYAFFAIGTTGGGALTGVTASVLGGFVGWVDWRLRLATFLVVGLGLVLYDARVARVDLPQAARQIPQTVFLADARWAAVRFGFEYGTGLRTYLTSAAPYVLASAIVLSAVRPMAGLVIGAAFGFGRSLSLLQYQLKRKPNWQGAVGRQSRLLERLGTVGTFGLLVAALLYDDIGSIALT